MAAMDLEDEENIWGNAGSSPSASPPQPMAAFISTQLSLNSRLHLLYTAAAGGSSASSPPHPIGAGIFAADGAGHHHLGLGGGGGGFHNAASASPAPFFPAYSLDAAGGGGIAPIDDAGAARSVLEDEMCLGPGLAAWAGAGVGGSDRRKKRMIKNRESAARSRARKQAYVRELEKEVQLLQQELESVRAKYEELRVSVEVPVRKTLQRMPSAPF
ncbi:unnamed protein product [Urochloa decumbens]|uniref:BZIP domain-containing protein n=1 Tax=Urochloa decumbens TaxID=240449 RepID=A0ABC9G328_9POAL